MRHLSTAYERGGRALAKHRADARTSGWIWRTDAATIESGNCGAGANVVSAELRSALSSQGESQKKDLWGGMCFSPEMDVAAGLTVGAIGVEALRHVRRSRDVPLGALPLAFGAHQLTEVFVWLGDSGHVAPTTARTATWLYMGFAYVVLPSVVPLAVLAVERNCFRRRAVARFAALGAVVSLLYLQAMLDGSVTAVVGGNRIAYDTGLSHGGFVAALYMLATVGALLASSHRRIVAFGKANLIVLPVLVLVYTEALASLWCGWAAVTSIIIAVHLRETATTEATSEAAIFDVTGEQLSLPARPEDPTLGVPASKC